MTRVFLFPGQSSRYPGMLDRAMALHEPNAALVSRASELLGRDLLSHQQSFDRNVDVQVGVFLANHLFLQALEARGITADVSLGLSLGEWNHLVHIGVLSFEDALRAVQARGEAYDAGPPGWMAAVQPIELDALQAALAALPDGAELEIVNLNSPRQHVIAGPRAAVEAAVQVLEDEHWTQPRIIERQIPMHHSSFGPVGVAFRETLETLPLCAPTRPYLPNRLGHILSDPTRAQLIELLATHVHRPVLWRRSIDAVVERWPDCVFVEVGPRKVLHDLLQKRWTRRPKWHCDHRDEGTMHFDNLVGKLVAQEG